MRKKIFFLASSLEFWCSLLVIQKLWSLSMFQTIFLPHQHGRSALDTSRTLFLLASTQGVSCRLVMNHLINMYMFSLTPPHIYVSKCMYVYVHISLFLPECACTTIIDISPRIFKLIYCCCVSIIILICICPPGALIWLINLFYSILFCMLKVQNYLPFLNLSQQKCHPNYKYIICIYYWIRFDVKNGWCLSFIF